VQSSKQHDLKHRMKNSLLDSFSSSLHPKLYTIRLTKSAFAEISLKSRSPLRWPAIHQLKWRTVRFSANSWTGNLHRSIGDSASWVYLINKTALLVTLLYLQRTQIFGGIKPTTSWSNTGIDPRCAQPGICFGWDDENARGYIWTMTDSGNSPDTGNV